MSWTEQEFLNQNIEFVEALIEYKIQISKKAESDRKK